MTPLTDNLPKPLLPVAGKALIEWQLEKLVAAGFRDLVVNVSHLGEQIETFLGNGERWGCDICYSREEEPLETAGGIQQALPLLGEDAFAIVNADVWTDYDFHKLAVRELDEDYLAHLVVVNNPHQHSRGDFRLRASGKLEFAQGAGAGTLTYAGIGVYHPHFFADLGPGKLPLRPLLKKHGDQGRLSGEHFCGDWEDIGTQERLAALDDRLGIL